PCTCRWLPARPAARAPRLPHPLKSRQDSSRTAGGWWHDAWTSPFRRKVAHVSGGRLRRQAGAAAALSAQRTTPQPWLRGFGVKTLAMTYSRMLNAHYHRRMHVSLPSSEWDRVVPCSYYHQGEGGGSRAVAGLTRTRSRWVASERS